MLYRRDIVGGSILFLVNWIEINMMVKSGFITISYCKNPSSISHKLYNFSHKQTYNIKHFQQRRFIYYRDSCWYAPVALKQSLKFIPVSYEKSKLWQWRVIHFILVSIKLSILISCEQWISNVNINPFWFLAQQISSISGSWSSKQKDYNWGRVATFPNKCRH